MAIYKCGQYEDAFDPRKLRNWESREQTNWSSKSQKKQRHNVLVGEKTFPVTSEYFVYPVLRAELVPNVNAKDEAKRSKTHGGKDRSRRDAESRSVNTSHHHSQIISNPNNKPTRYASPPSSHQQQQQEYSISDPILQRIRTSRVPIIWIVGQPTTSTRSVVRSYCNQLAQVLDFSFISLDETIGEWYERELLLTPAKYWQTVTSDRLNKSPQQQQQQHATTENSGQVSVHPPRRGVQIRVRAKLTDSLCALCSSYDREVKHSIKNSEEFTLGSSSKRFKAETIGGLFSFKRLSDIHLDTREPLRREKVMELLKYALVERLSPNTSGFIIDGSFMDRLDYVKFRQMLYAPQVGLYFTESVINVELSRYVESLKSPQKITPKNNNRDPRDEFEKGLRSKVTLARPRNFRRLKEYSFLEAERLCDEFKDKLIRVVNAEHLNKPTVRFVNTLVKAHLRGQHNYKNQKYNQQSNSNYKNPPNRNTEVVSRDEVSPPKVFISRVDPEKMNSENDDPQQQSFDSLSSASVSQTQDDPEDNNDFRSRARQIPSHLTPRIHQDKVSQSLIDSAFEKLRAQSLPIIWIYGFPQTAILGQRLKTCRFLAKYFDFTFLRMDQQILRWHKYNLKDFNSWDDPDDSSPWETTTAHIHDIIFQRAKRIIKRIMPTLTNRDNKGTYLTKDETFDLIKYAMLHSLPTNGFIIDQLPLNRADGLEFERRIYPPALGIYFCSSERHRNERMEPKVERPKYFLRGPAYSENSVDGICQEFRHKTIKVINVEELRADGVEEICQLVSKHLQRYAFHNFPGALDNEEGERKSRGRPRIKSTQPEVLVIRHSSVPVVKGGIAKKGKERKVSPPGGGLWRIPGTGPQKKIILKENKTGVSVGVNVHVRRSRTTLNNKRQKNPDLGLNAGTTSPRRRDQSPTADQAARRRRDKSVIKLWENTTSSIVSVPSESQNLSPDQLTALDLLYEEESIDPENYSQVNTKRPGPTKRSSHPGNKTYHNEFAFLGNFVDAGGNYSGAAAAPSPGANTTTAAAAAPARAQSYWKFADYILKQEYIPEEHQEYQHSQFNTGVDPPDDIPDGIVSIPKLSMPSTVYETANSSEDDFDEDDEDPDVIASKTSTLQGLVFGADGRKSKGGLLSPNSRTNMVMVNSQRSALRARFVDEDETSSSPTLGNTKVLNNEKAGENKGKKNIPKKESFWTTILRTFRIKSNK